MCCSLPKFSFSFTPVPVLNPDSPMQELLPKKMPLPEIPPPVYTERECRDIKITLQGVWTCSNNACNHKCPFTTTIIHNTDTSIFDATHQFSGYVQNLCEHCNNNNGYFIVHRIENITE